MLGAYERGERAISVPRLQRLARFYRVPVDQLLPGDEGPDFGATEPVDLTDKRQAREALSTVTIDLTRLESRHRPRSRHAHRYLQMIQVQRQDFNGRVLTIRRDDLRAIAAILGTDSDSASSRLDDLGLATSQHQERRLGTGPPKQSFRPGSNRHIPVIDAFGVYLHVPFCSRKCDYCAFATWTDRHHLTSRYLAACRTEAERLVASGIPRSAGVRGRRHPRRWSPRPASWPCSTRCRSPRAWRSRWSATRTPSPGSSSRRTPPAG